VAVARFILSGRSSSPRHLAPKSQKAFPHYLDVEFQQKYLERFPDFDKYLPYNSFSRRNIGDLFAYEKGFDSIIRVDDDNFPTNDDFIGYHSVIFGDSEHVVIESGNGWYNICEGLVDVNHIPFYPRGFPYSKRWKGGEISKTMKKVKVVLNAGLWLGDPDIDAITRLSFPIDVKEYTKIHGEHFVLEKGTWCSTNTQNTAYSRDIIPASFVSPFTGRYDDIWSGYLLRKVMDHLGEYVSYGLPLLKQDRNVHNLWNDLELEMNGNLYTDHLIECLQPITLSGSDYASCYYELAEKLEGMLSENREVFDKVLVGMKIWTEAINKTSNI